MSKANSKNVKKNQPKRKKPFPIKNLIIGIIVGVLLCALIVFLVFKTNEDNASLALRGTYWVSQSAKTASGDEVDIREVYNTKYSSYQGRLHFDSDGKFELWLQPGDSEDGTHSGTYELKEDRITAVFDEGTATDFAVIRKDGAVVQIDVSYNDYVVSFFPQ